jgi:hypothetical protein
VRSIAFDSFPSLSRSGSPALASRRHAIASSDRNRIPLARNDTCPSRVPLGSNEAVIRSLASAFAVTASASSTTTSARQRTASRFGAPIAAHATQELARLSPRPRFDRPPPGASGRIAINATSAGVAPGRCPAEQAGGTYEREVSS